MCLLIDVHILQVKQALRCGCVPSKIVFDSPCKSAADIEFALRSGVNLNANSYEEVSKIDAVLKTLARERFVSKSVVGLRINPMVGAGKIAALSTATATSKFGVPCLGVELREKILLTFEVHPFLTGIMCHVGSQGMPIETMVQGAECIFTLADEIDARCAGAYSNHRITHIDIGGGLSANYDSAEVSPTFREYAQSLAKTCGERHSKSAHRVIVTEFGKALIAKAGVIASAVEECNEMEALNYTAVNSNDIAEASTCPSVDTVVNASPHGEPRSVLAVIQAGADLLLRTCYCPDKFPHRVAFLDAQKVPLTSVAVQTEVPSMWSITTKDCSAARLLGNVTVAGPLCFSGDVICRNQPMATPTKGDVCLILDAGANTLSLFSKHCSRLSPPVFAFRRVRLQNKQGEAIGKSVYLVSCIREGEKESDLLEFWG